MLLELVGPGVGVPAGGKVSLVCASNTLKTLLPPHICDELPV